MVISIKYYPFNTTVWKALKRMKFYSLTWALKLPPSKHTDTITWHARPFAITFYRQAHSFLGR
jgi:hypothetical protein